MHHGHEGGDIIVFVEDGHGSDLVDESQATFFV